ncbi:hypothetical protein ACIP8U_00695 [Streptomyces pseudovenezuelae]|uniref:hypothetical protein n=1 Tax=Streptomyces pseudovenezuelae TaxID=67350 RepID=UPI003818AC62
MTRPIADLDVPVTVLRQRIRALVARQRELATGQVAPDPRVGLNPTGRPRRSSAPSRRKQARRAAVLAPTHTTPEEGK